MPPLDLLLSALPALQDPPVNCPYYCPFPCPQSPSTQPLTPVPPHTPPPRLLPSPTPPPSWSPPPLPPFSPVSTPSAPPVPPHLSRGTSGGADPALTPTVNTLMPSADSSGTTARLRPGTSRWGEGGDRGRGMGRQQWWWRAVGGRESQQVLGCVRNARGRQLAGLQGSSSAQESHKSTESRWSGAQCW